MKKKCAICNNPSKDCIAYKESFICEDCLGYIHGLVPLKQELKKSCEK